jgi:predicted AAA+ superfamily ATPase
MDAKDIFEESTTYALDRPLKPREIDLDSIIRRSDLKIVAVTGARRSGKSSILMLLAQKLGVDGKKVAYINAEDSRLGGSFLDDLIKWFGDEGYLLVDEITSAEDWAGWLARNHEMLKGRLRIIVSSSRSGLTNPPKALRGRVASVEVFPLSFEELLQFHGIGREATTAGRGRMERAFQSYMRFGGFPEVALMSEDLEKIEALDDYFKAILGLDVAEASGADVAAVTLFGRYVLDSPYFSASKCLNYFKSVGHKIGKEKLLDLEHYSQESYLFFFVPVFGRSVKDAAQYPRKAYPVDTGFFYAVAGTSDQGRILECEIFLELRRRLRPGEEISYWRDRTGREVDFLVRRGNDIAEAVQVCYELGDPKTVAREVDSLKRCLDELRVAKGLLITFDPRGMNVPDDKRISIVDALDWTLRGEETTTLNHP